MIIFPLKSRIEAREKVPLLRLLRSGDVPVELSIIWAFSLHTYKNYYNPSTI